jgi:hypothetical protein
VLVISVADTGIGIAPEDIARLFTPFVQGESGPARRFDGSGLGLTISRQLSQLMGGELMLDSTLGVGTRVTLRVPMPACPDAGSPCRTLRDESITPTSDWYRGRHRVDAHDRQGTDAGPREKKSAR